MLLAQNFYTWIGLQNEVVVAFFLLSLAYLLAPWFGGVQFGVLAVPQLSAVQLKWQKFCAPTAFVLIMLGFTPLWPNATVSPPQILPNPNADLLAQITANAFAMENELKGHSEYSIDGLVDTSRKECSNDYLAIGIILSTFSARDVVRNYEAAIGISESIDRKLMLTEMDRQTRSDYNAVYQSIGAAVQNLNAKNCII